MLKPNSVNLERKSSMHTIRANFGIYLNIRQGCIYVVGGDTGPCSQTYKTEAYCLLTDRWTNLPNIGDIRAGMGLCMLNDQYLYSFGGYSKQHGEVPLLNIIERLNVKTKLFWEQVHLTMPSPAIDIGCIQAGVNEIL